MDFIDRITGNRKQGWHTRPWRTRLPGGIYLTRDKDAWMYRIMELSSLEWEDAPKRLNDQQRFERLIIELGDTSRDLGQGTRSLTQSRHLHIVSMLVDHPSVLDTSITPELEALHQQLTPLTTTMKYVFVGVKLRRDAMAALMTSDSDDGGWSRMKRAMKSMRDDDVSAYQLDIEKIGNILARSGATEPTDDDLNWLESWFNNGKGVDVTLAASDTRIKLPDTSGWQLSAFMGIDEQDMWLSSPDAAWALDAMNHPDGADVVSIRCALEPSTVTRSRLRRSQRIIAAQEEEEEATGDIARDELGERRHKAKDVENYTRSAGHAWLTNTSVLFARKLGMDGTRAPDETFADNIGSAYGMAVKPLEKRQLQALAEMLPGESPIVNPFLQDVNPAWVAYAGLTGFGDVGDDTGLLLGESAPHYTPVRVDYLAAAKKNKGPAMCVFGRPGSGKTFAAQFIAGQAALNGTASILINPKGHDSLAPFAHWVTRSGGQAQIVSLSKLEEQGGAFDPFRFCEPRMAAEVLDRHIVSVLGQSVNGGMTGRQETELSRGLAEGADKGALCAAQALAYVRDDDVRDMVLAMAESNSLFRLGFGFTPQQAWGTTGGFTLIEFDREMAWPTAGKNPADYDRPERVAVAALRLVSRASLEILMRAGGGVLVVDEAHHFLASAEGRATVDRINREGRSLKLLPIFCTQRVTDLVNDSAVDMETFISRVLVLNLPDHNESAAALTLCGLAPTDSRVSYLRTSPSGWGFFRDIDDRHSIVHVGAGISSELHQAMSTNYTDRQARDDVS